MDDANAQANILSCQLKAHKRAPSRFAEKRTAPFTPPESCIYVFSRDLERRLDTYLIGQLSVSEMTGKVPSRRVENYHILNITIIIITLLYYTALRLARHASS